MQSPMRLPGANRMRQDLVEKNTFLDCSSPWALQSMQTLQKSASDPGTSRRGSIFSMSKDVSQFSLGVSTGCATGTDIGESSYGESLDPSDFSSASESPGSSIDLAYTAKDNDSWSAATIEGSSYGDFLPSSDFTDAAESSGSIINPAHSAKDDDSVAAVSDERPSALESLSSSCGSELHRNGTCKPCKFVTRRNGCFLADRCSFCHYPHLLGHPGTKWRPSKKKRQMCKDALSQMTVVLPTPDGSMGWSCAIGELPASISQNSHIMQKLVEKIANHHTEPQYGVVYRL